MTYPFSPDTHPAYRYPEGPFAGTMLHEGRSLYSSNNIRLGKSTNASTDRLPFHHEESTIGIREPHAGDRLEENRQSAGTKRSERSRSVSCPVYHQLPGRISIRDVLLDRAGRKALPSSMEQEI